MFSHAWNITARKCAPVRKLPSRTLLVALQGISLNAAWVELAPEPLAWASHLTRAARFSSVVEAIRDMAAISLDWEDPHCVKDIRDIFQC